MEKKYRSVVVHEKRINVLLNELNERKIKKDDIVYLGPIDDGYACVYYR